jgi:Cu-Zn family superoxide dismutase
MLQRSVTIFPRRIPFLSSTHGILYQTNYIEPQHKEADMKKRVLFMLACTFFFSYAIFAEDVVVTINLISPDGTGKSVGKITATDSKDGLILKPELTGLPPGVHGFHVHENASCDPADKDGKKTAGQAAGGHYDPKKTGKHLGPNGDGHLGDLPPIEVAADGTATKEVVAPRMKAADLKGHAVMIHAGGDNFMDHPEPLGGGGGRIACGVAK